MSDRALYGFHHGVQKLIENVDYTPEYTTFSLGKKTIAQCVRCRKTSIGISNILGKERIGFI